MHTVPSLSNEPNVIIGLISSALTGKGPTSATPWDTETIGIDDHLRYSSPERLRQAPTNLRKVLDAIVGVSALPSHNAVLACGIRSHDLESVLELVLCSFTSISPVTVQHIHRIWTLMADISTLRSTGENIKSSSINFDCVLLDFAMPDLRQTFESDTRTVMEWRTKSDLLHLQLKDDPDVIACILAFADVVETASVCNTLLQNMSAWSSDIVGPVSDEWTEFRESLAKLNTLIDHLINLVGYWQWTYMLKGKHEINTCLKRIGHFPKHLRALRKYARSRRHRFIFRFSLCVTCMDPLHPKTGTPWPSSTQQWTEIRDHIYAERRRTFIGSEGVHDLSLLPKQPEQLVMHPELAILTYLNHKSLHGNSQSLPYNYIAISGLACKTCSLWIRLYNELDHDVGFAISGSNNEWVPGWCMPEIRQESDELRKSFILACLLVYFTFTSGDQISGRPEPHEDEELEWHRESKRQLLDNLPY